jgi:D-glycero-alpha-D-manno-heptose-7-phosphate kinase
VSVVVVRAPLRISLGGGGTDLPSYYESHEGFVVSGAIDKYIYFFLHTSFERTYRLKYSEFEEVDHAEQIRHPLLREVLVRFWDGSPLEIASVADVPTGTGLGSSGAYTVGLLKGLALRRRVMTTPASLAEDACTIEIDVLGQPVGKQDQYVSAHGGISSYAFRPDGSVEVTPLALSSDTLEQLRENLLLFFTGRTRSAAAILADQAERSAVDDQQMLSNLHGIKELAFTARDQLQSGAVEEYARSMHQHWELKRTRSEAITSPEIDDLYTLARRSGALGGKVVGAGGGGYLLVYSPRPHDTREAMNAAGVPELRFDFEFQGCSAVQYG